MKNIKDELLSIVDLFKSREVSKAEEACKILIKRNVKMAFLHNLLGLILTEQNKYDEAIKNYEIGLKIDPQFAIIYNNLGLLYVKQNKKNYFEKAEIYYKKSIEINNKLLESHNNLGTLYNSVFMYKKAIKCYENTLNINKKFYIANYNLATIYTSIGNLKKAKENLNKSIKLNQNFTPPHRLLSRILKYTKDNEHFKILVSLYKNLTNKNEEDKINICFSLGKAYEDIKDYRKSFFYYKEGNDLLNSKTNFSIKKEKDFFSRIKLSFNNFNIKSNNNQSKTIFIIGMPRSGTTLIEQILSNHPKVFGADEVNFIPDLVNKFLGNPNSSIFLNNLKSLDNKSFYKIGNEYLSLVKKLSNEAEITTDKLPINFLWVGFIKKILPNSKIIHCQRDPRDNIFSIYKNYFPGGEIKFASNINNIISYYKLYSDLMKHWNKVLPLEIYNIRYENLVKNTNIEIKNILKFCNLAYSDLCIDFHKNKRPIKTASDVQARNKIYNSSINSWKKYDDFLGEYFKKIEI